jgi:hypothetical protein
LSDFSVRHSLARTCLAPDLQLFAFHAYCGVFYKGELRLYETATGEVVWECGDHEGHDITLLAPPSSQHWIGIYGSSGVWLLRSRRLSEHTQLLSHALFPVTTNADETTPGDYLEQGRELAASLCRLWGLPLAASRCGLEALLGIVQRDREEEGAGEGDLFLPRLSLELQGVLREASLQSPALLVALLAEHPCHRGLTTEAVHRYLQGLPDSADTPVTNEVAPLLKTYHTLSLHYDAEINQHTADVARQLLQSPSATTCSLLHRLEGCHDNGRVSLRARLQLLSCQSPSATLSGLRQFLALPSFSAAVEAIGRGDWDSERDWKSMFGTETGSGLGGKVLETLAPSVPVFELTCRLLYREQPAELVSFVTFAQLARDRQAQGDSSFARRCRETYHFQRALECLPQFVSPEATPTSREALLAHSGLLLHSERSGCEGSALGLLLRGRLWEDAVAFLEQDPRPSPHIFCALFRSLLAAMTREEVLHHYIERVWQLVPQAFSVFDFLSLLAHSPTRPPPLLLPNHTSLTVADVGSKLLQLLPKDNVALSQSKLT